MSDDADVTQERLESEAALFAKRRREPGLVAIGACYFCSETLGRPFLFCGAECRDDYEIEQRALQRAGRR